METKKKEEPEVTETESKAKNKPKATTNKTTAKTATKNKGGRPKFIIDYALVEKLAQIMCTQEEIANFLGCSRDTLLRDQRFCDIYKKGLDSGKMSLRRAQFKMAQTNTTMAIWLGKQYLGQTDKNETQYDNNVKVKIVNDLEESD